MLNTAAPGPPPPPPPPKPLSRSLSGGSGPSVGLKRAQPSGHSTVSGRSRAVQRGGATRRRGSGHTISSSSFSSTFSSSSVSLSFSGSFWASLPALPLGPWEPWEPPCGASLRCLVLGSSGKGAAVGGQGWDGDCRFNGLGLWAIGRCGPERFSCLAQKCTRKFYIPLNVGPSFG